MAIFPNGKEEKVVPGTFQIISLALFPPSWIEIPLLLTELLPSLMRKRALRNAEPSGLLIYCTFSVMLVVRDTVPTVPVMVSV
jgi:hypothetical protein